MDEVIVFLTQENIKWTLFAYDIPKQLIDIRKKSMYGAQITDFLKTAAIKQSKDSLLNCESNNLRTSPHFQSVYSVFNSHVV